MTATNFISRREAKVMGLKRYYLGKRCIHGHNSERWVSTAACIKCCKKLPPDPPEEELQRLKNYFDWTDNIRAVLIDEYVNTGDIMAAREAVHVSAAAYYRELEINQEFSDAIKKATILALQTLEDKAIHHAHKGNDKLIIAVLKAKYPDQYSERIKVDTNHTVKLSDAELDRRIAKLSGSRVIEHLPQLPANPRRIDIARYEARVAEITGGKEAANGAQQNQDTLS
jgi:hypothetical protein